MVRFGLLFLVVLLAAGCTSVGTHSVIHSPYEGVPAATLFARWGAPVTAKPLADGGRVYLWYSGGSAPTSPARTARPT
jgi:hypothetical protein